LLLYIFAGSRMATLFVPLRPSILWTSLVALLVCILMLWDQKMPVNILLQ
jgi:hypothetical protein